MLGRRIPGKALAEHASALPGICLRLWQRRKPRRWQCTKSRRSYPSPTLPLPAAKGGSVAPSMARHYRASICACGSGVSRDAGDARKAEETPSQPLPCLRQRKGAQCRAMLGKGIPGKASAEHGSALQDTPVFAGVAHKQKPRRSGVFVVMEAAHCCAVAITCSRARRGRCRPGADGRSSSPDQPAVPANAIPNQRYGPART